MRLQRPRLGSVTLSVLTAAFLLFFTNRTFWRKGVAYFAGHEGELVLLGLALFLVLVALLTALSVKYATKPIFIALVLIAACASYYVDTFGILLTHDMIQNIAMTTTSEAGHLVNADLVLHLALFGLLPALFIAAVRIQHRPLLRKAGFNLLVILPALLTAGGLVLVGYPVFASTVRQHRDLLASLNPVAPVAATVKFVSRQIGERNVVAQPLGRDATQVDAVARSPRPVLTIIVVGETARAQSFGLNGTARDTTPELRDRSVAHFTDVRSCGTSTAVSVPCMFSIYPRAEYSEYRALSTENLTDVLTHAGLAVRWFDNDTGAYRVADRIPYEFLPATDDPRFCRGGECLDDILVDRLRRELPEVRSNTVLVLHQLGSHGPAYHERYPAASERFTPACHTAQFADCTHTEIVNAYDNTIGYTDHVLAEIVDLLASRPDLASSLIYVSDHGESLGENGIYLHGAPYFLAPSTQTQVPMIAWFSDSYQQLRPTALDCLGAKRDASLSQDNLFHTVLGMAGVSTSVYDPTLDAFASCRSSAPTRDIASTQEVRG